jgi:methyl-accepting chemotaxis protein
MSLRARSETSIGTIDSIAFQTNILALNAAVEAARASVPGRGFAVVATQVRALSQRTSPAAREVKTLIDASVQQVFAGFEAVREAGAAIEEIVQSSRRVNELLGEIAAGAAEQSRGVSGTTKAVQDLDKVRQRKRYAGRTDGGCSDATARTGSNLDVEKLRPLAVG